MPRQELFMNPDPEKGIKCYVDADFEVRWNQEEGNYPVVVLSIKGYVITYTNCPIIWGSRIQTEIAPSTTEVEHIATSQEMSYVLPLVSIIEETKFLLKIQGDTLTVMCSIFKKLVIVYKTNQWAITLAFFPKM